MINRKNYIDNHKVTVLFDALKAENRLCEKNFIEAFKQKFPNDYKLLETEWELKKREFRKNRKGTPKPYPIKPYAILQKIYRTYYFKLIKQPVIKKIKDKELSDIRAKAGRYDCKIIRLGNTKTYNIINKRNKEILYEKCSVKDLRDVFCTKEGKRILLEKKKAI